MPKERDRRRGERRPANTTGVVSFGQGDLSCRVIDVSESGAQIRIDGHRASRNLLGKRISLQAEAMAPDPLDGFVVWVRPAVNGVYLGLQLGTNGTHSRSAAE